MSCGFGSASSWPSPHENPSILLHGAKMGHVAKVEGLACQTSRDYIPYGRKFWRGIYFGGLAVLRAIRQYFIRQKLHSVISHYCEIMVCVLAAAKFASLIAGMEFTIESCVRGHRFSKEFCTPKEKSWLVCQRDEGDSNDVYTVAVKTDGTKTVQIKRSNDLVSFHLHLIIDFVLTERKLAHGNVKFPACSISHFALNIIMAG